MVAVPIELTVTGDGLQRLREARQEVETLQQDSDIEFGTGGTGFPTAISGTTVGASASAIRPPGGLSLGGLGTGLLAGRGLGSIASGASGALSSIGSTLAGLLPAIGILSAAVVGFTGAVSIIGAGFFDRIGSIRQLSTAFLSIDGSISSSRRNLIDFTTTLRTRTLDGINELDGRTRVLFLNLPRQYRDQIDQYAGTLADLTDLTDEEAIALLSTSAAGRLSAASFSELAGELGLTDERLRELINRGDTEFDGIIQLIQEGAANADGLGGAFLRVGLLFSDLGAQFRASNIGMFFRDLALGIETGFATAFENIFINATNWLKRILGFGEEGQVEQTPATAGSTLITNIAEAALDLFLGALQQIPVIGPLIGAGLSALGYLGRDNEDDGDGGGGDGFPDDDETYSTSPFFGYRGRNNDGRDGLTSGFGFFNTRGQRNRQQNQQQNINVDNRIDLTVNLDGDLVYAGVLRRLAGDLRGFTIS